MNDTPRTDAEEKLFFSSINGLPYPSRNYVSVTFARTLERELNAEVEKAIRQQDKLISERDQLRAEVERLRASWESAVKLANENADSVVIANREIDEWQAVADELACGLRIWHDSDMDSKHPAIAAYEKLKGESK